jgi:hypothetical protein
MADLQVEVMGKDEGVMDDYIGKFTLSVTPGTKEVEIEGTVFKIVMGTFWIKVTSPLSWFYKNHHPIPDRKHSLARQTTPPPIPLPL